jgi:hypothetical protein
MRIHLLIQVRLFQLDDFILGKQPLVSDHQERDDKDKTKEAAQQDKIGSALLNPYFLYFIFRAQQFIFLLPALHLE